MDINVTIERIDNGFIVKGKGVTEGKHYFRSLDEFAFQIIVEELREIDKTIKEHETPSKPFKFKLISNL